MDRFQTVHREDAECRGRHCISCDLDEVVNQAHTVCPECNHVYPTEQHLIAEYLGEELEVIQGIWEAFSKVKTFYCPKCLHFWGKRVKN